MRKLGRLEDAEPILNLLIQSRTRLPEVYRDLGELADQRGEAEQAAHWRDKWLNQESNRASQRWEQACVAEKLGRTQQALHHLQQLLSIQPRHLEGIQHTARILLRNGKTRQAREMFERWLEEASYDQEAQVCFAACLLELHQTQEAERQMQLAQNPKAPELQPPWQKLLQSVEARLYQNQGKEQQALDMAERLLDGLNATEDHWIIHRLLAPILLEQQELQRLSSVIEQAIQVQPEVPELRGMKAECLLLQGHLKAGYTAFNDQLLLQKNRSRQPDKDQNHDDKAANHEKGPLNLVASGTLGDTLMLSRYATWLQAVLQRPTHLFVQPPLVALLQDALGGGLSVQTVASLPRERKANALPLISLPALFGSCEEHAALQQPHLRANPELIEEWRERIGLNPDEALVGLNWHGSALQALSERHSSDIPLETLAPLSQIPGLRFVSLQKGVGLEQLKDCSFRQKFVSIQEELSREQRLEHLAAVISLCRCVVVDDSGPAHLAGCLGVPGIVLLPERINWRWGSTDPHRSAWYPTLRLLRQGSQQQWPELVAKATQWLSDRLNHPLCDETPGGGTAFG